MNQSFHSRWVWICVCLVWLTSPGLSLQAQSAREWTINGKPVNAVLKATDAQKRLATIELPGGQQIPVPWDKFSAVDQTFLQNQDPATSSEAKMTTAFKAEWPSDVTVDVSIPVEEKRDGSLYLYVTPHFQFESPVPLGQTVVREFARLFETVYQAVKTVPFGLEPKPPQGHFLVRLFRSNEDYFAAGGIPGSAGCYRGGERDVLVPLASLGVKKVGERYAMDDAGANQTLLHELAHQMMHDWFNRTDVWMSEGWAEFFAAQRYRTGRMSFANPGRSVAEYLKENRGAFDGSMPMVSPLDLMALTDDAWESALAGSNGEANTNYASAAVLATYFIVADLDGKAMWDYLRAVESGTPIDEAEEKFLIRGRDRATMENDVAAAMKRYALKLEFLPATRTTSP